MSATRVERPSYPAWQTTFLAPPSHRWQRPRGRTKLSKYGNARLRRTLWLAAQVAIRQRENSFRDKFERYIARDRDNPDLRRKALTAITAKMARIVHAVIKSGSDYRPFFEGMVPGGRPPSVEP